MPTLRCSNNFWCTHTPLYIYITLESLTSAHLSFSIPTAQDSSSPVRILRSRAIFHSSYFFPIVTSCLHVINYSSLAIRKAALYDGTYLLCLNTFSFFILAACVPRNSLSSPFIFLRDVSVLSLLILITLHLFIFWEILLSSKFPLISRAAVSLSLPFVRRTYFFFFFFFLDDKLYYPRSSTVSRKIRF